MARTNAVHSYGTRLLEGALFTTPTTDIAEVVDISGPNITVSAPDATHLQSDFAFREFLAGLGDGGEVTFTLNYTRAQMTTMMGLLRVMWSWQIVFPDADGIVITIPSTFDFDGHITALGDSFEEDDVVSQDVTIKVTGLPVFTEGS